MIGVSHATSGAVGWLLIAPALDKAGAIQATPAVLACGTVICAGGALLPDWDKPGTTISRFLGPVSDAVARVLNVIAGGHRQGTHSLLFAILVGVGSWAAVTKFGMAAIAILIFLMSGLAARALNLAPREGTMAWGGIALIAVTVTAVTALFGPPDFNWLPYAIGGGCLIGTLGDMITPQGVPLLWPYGYRFKIPILPRTGSGWETGLLTPAMTLAGCYLAWATILAPALA